MLLVSVANRLGNIQQIVQTALHLRLLQDFLQAITLYILLVVQKA